MRSVAPLHLPGEDDIAGRVVLRDGTVAAIRPTTLGDLHELRIFFSAFTDPVVRRRFRTDQPDDVFAAVADSTSPDRGFSLAAWRTQAGVPAVIGVGSYWRASGDRAEVAFAVGESMQGNGLGTALLDRLIVKAAQHGVHAFEATMAVGHDAMLDVFRRSGFEQRATAEGGHVHVDLTLVPTAAAVWAAEERERLATSASVRRILSPGSVAVVGVSRRAASIGRRVFRAIRGGGFTGAVYPVTQAVNEIDGVPTYRTVSDIGAAVDLAIVAVPHAAVPSVVDDCAAAGVKGLVVISAGFAEAGPEGRRRQAALLDQVRGYGMRMVGPNCMGIMNAHPAISLNASFSPLFPPSGGLALLSQSGALGVIVLGLAAERRLGLSTFVSVGNKADLSGNDLLQYWEADPATAVIALYLESFGHPQRFSRIARRVSRQKPIVAVKAGRTLAGSRAAGSHTAALAANDAAVTALFRHTGVIRVETIDELLDVAGCLETQPLPAGRRVGIVTNAGGPGILAADACMTHGLVVPEFSRETRTALEAFLPEEAGLSNPVDMIATATAGAYGHTIDVVLSSPDVDTLLVLYTSLDTTSMPAVLGEIQDAIGRVRAAGIAKPVVACVMAAGARPTLQIGTERIPVFFFPENAARALGKIADYADWRQSPPGVFWEYPDLDRDRARAICRGAVTARGSGWLTGEETAALLEAAGLPVVSTSYARTADETAHVAERLGLPVVVKMRAKGLVHKTEVGGIITRVSTPAAARDAFDTLAARARHHDLEFQDVIVQPMIEDGVETMIGVIRDPLFGPLVGCGLGGTSVEVLGDVQFRLAPLTDRDVAELIDGTRASRLLAGYRGRPAGDRTALEELLSRVAVLAEAVAEIDQLDLNPVLVRPAGQGCLIVDARVRVTPIA